MGSNYHGVHEPLALELRKRYRLKTFIETGTFAGESTDWALAHGFAEVYTIESNRERWNSLYEKYPPASQKKVHFCPGMSQLILPIVLEMAKNPALIFLDAHDAQNSGSEHPVLKEIEAIKNCPIRHIVMIDDAHLFGVGINWPSLGKVISALEETGRKVFVREGVIIGEYKDVKK